MDRMQKRLDAMEKLRREIDDLEEELLTAKRRWKNSSETLHQLTEEKQRKVYRLSQFEEIMKKTGLIDGYDPDELYLVLLTNRKRSLEVTDDLLDTFIQFAGNHQNGAGDTARSPARPPLLLRQLLQKNLRKKRAISSHMLRPESHPVASRGAAPESHPSIFGPAGRKTFLSSEPDFFVSSDAPTLSPWCPDRVP